MNTKSFASLCIGLVCAAAFVLVGDIGDASAAPAGKPAKYAPDTLLVRFTPGLAAAGKDNAHAGVGASVQKHFKKIDGLDLVKLPPGLSVQEAIKKYRKNPNVRYAEPDFTVRALAPLNPDDPAFVAGQLTGLNNANDADIDAPEAWGTGTTGNTGVVVAVLDSGVDYSHPDLTPNIYSSATDCNTNGMDDDSSGYADDCHGIDVLNNDSDPMDDGSHGTHVAGTIGAKGNNTTGVVGVNWDVTILPCKFLDASGFGTMSGAIACIDYVAAQYDNGVNIVAVNASWGGYAFSQGLYDAINVALRSRGVLFITAAGDNSANNDTSEFYPADYYLPNVISVAATTSTDALWSFSNYGRRTVHLGAPGENILSTLPCATTPLDCAANAYGTKSGTSMSAAHVSGVAALLNAQAGTANDYMRDWKAVRNLILAGGDNDGALTNTVTGKRLNANGSLTCSNKTVASRLRPIGTAVTASVGTPADLAFLNINCDAPNGNVNVTVNPGSLIIPLHDDASQNDQVAGDGVYSARWTPTQQGTHTLTFPGNDVVTVNVVQPYSYSSVAPADYSYRTITGTSLNLNDDSSAPVTPGFPILFGGGNFSTVYVSSNGTLTFDAPFSVFSNSPLPTPSIGTLVAPFWDDLNSIPNTDQNVFWAVTGSSPNRELVIEWRNLGQYDCAGNGTVKFQVVFFEGSSNILFNYADVSFGGSCTFADQGGSATVGVQVGTLAANQYSFNGTTPLTDGTAFMWTLGAATPAMSVTPVSIDFGNVVVGGFADRTFTVQNVGGGTLTGTASAASPFSIVQPTDSFSLAAGASAGVVVRFTPLSATTSSGNVGLTSNGGSASPIVTGTGVAPANVDLVETAVSNFPAAAAPGGSFSVSDTVKNNGTSAAGASTTRYYVSLDKTLGAGDILLAGSRAVPGLLATKTSNGSATVTVPSTTALGTYYLIACADDLNAVAETNEGNNCLASTGTIQVTRPDLIVTANTIPSAAVAPGGTFKVSDTVKNTGLVGAGAFTVTYYLSMDGVKDNSDVAIGSRSLSSLNAGQNSSVGTDVTIQTNTAPGQFTVFSCADDPNSVIETNEGNNCLASATKLTVALPDLVVTTITIPTVAVPPGNSFQVTDSVKNQGLVAAGAFIVTYYLSTDALQDGTDVILGNRPVSSLNAGSTSNGNVNVTIPTTTVAGKYYVLSCADTLNGVNEGDELNNCIASPLAVGVGPDLITTAVSNPPLTIAAGGTFRVTDTVRNQGSTTAGASTTRHYLSTNQTKDGADIPFAATRAVGSLTSGKTSSGNVTVTVPAAALTNPPTSYYVLACADDGPAMTELDETNNCLASTTKVTVQ